VLETRKDGIGRIEQRRIAALKVTRQEIIGNQIQLLPFTRFQDNVVAGRPGKRASRNIGVPLDKSEGSVKGKIILCGAQAPLGLPKG